MSAAIAAETEEASYRRYVADSLYMLPRGMGASFRWNIKEPNAIDIGDPWDVVDSVARAAGLEVV